MRFNRTLKIADLDALICGLVNRRLRACSTPVIVRGLIENSSARRCRRRRHGLIRSSSSPRTTLPNKGLSSCGVWGASSARQPEGDPTRLDSRLYRLAAGPISVMRCIVYINTHRRCGRYHRLPLCGNASERASERETSEQTQRTSAGRKRSDVTLYHSRGFIHTLSRGGLPPLP